MPPHDDEKGKHVRLLSPNRWTGGKVPSDATPDAIYVEKHVRDWDCYLPYLLYATEFLLKSQYVRAPSFCSTAVIPDNPLMKHCLVLQLCI